MPWVSPPSFRKALGAELRVTQSVEFIEFFGLTQETQQAQETKRTLAFPMRHALCLLGGRQEQRALQTFSSPPPKPSPVKGEGDASQNAVPWGNAPYKL